MTSSKTRKQWKKPVIMVFPILLAMIMSCCQLSNEQTLTLTFTGDFMPDRGTRKVIEKHGFHYLFLELDELLNNSDFTITNLECTACDNTLIPVDKPITLRANPEWLDSLRRERICILNLANNHNCDFGSAGLEQTLSKIKETKQYALGINNMNVVTGAPLEIEKGKNHVAVFSNSIFRQTDKRINCLSLEQLIEAVKHYRITHQSCNIVVYLHWGIEGRSHPEPTQRAEAHQLIDAGADLIIGGHSHVCQDIEVYQNKCIFYSLGNFIFDNDKPPYNRGMMAVIKVQNNKIKDIQKVNFQIRNCRPEKLNKENIPL